MMKQSELKYFCYFQVFSSGRRETGGGFSRTGSSSLSLLPYFDMADLASSGPYIVSIPSGSQTSLQPRAQLSYSPPVRRKGGGGLRKYENVGDVSSQLQLECISCGFCVDFIFFVNKVLHEKSAHVEQISGQE